MIRPLVVVRPEPGNARTVAAALAAGRAAEPMPLFAVRPLAWTPPAADRFDAVLLTSANAALHGGTGLAALCRLPVLAVGKATAAAASAAGLSVVLVGDGDGAALVERSAACGYRRLLHLAGRERAALAVDAVVPVYASEPLAPPVDLAARLAGATVLLHSARAARRLAALVEDRGATALAAISPSVLDAAGAGWSDRIAAARPTDAALLTAAAALRD